MSEECKTVEAYLAPPTQHKQRKLRDEYDRYETLLHRSFNNECDTMTAVNEVVSGEDLNWPSKNALKQHIPNLLDEDTYNANQLADDQPIRYANTTAVFDHDKKAPPRNLLGGPTPRSRDKLLDTTPVKSRTRRLVARTHQRRQRKRVGGRTAPPTRRDLMGVARHCKLRS